MLSRALKEHTTNQTAIKEKQGKITDTENTMYIPSKKNSS